MDDLRLDVEVAARSTGVSAVLSEMRALSRVATQVSQGTRATSAGLNTVAGASQKAAKSSSGLATAAGAAAVAGARQATAAQQVSDSLGRATRNQGQYNDITARYISYDMAGTLLTVAGAITAVGAATAVAFAQQERAFTEVERILGIDPNVDVSSIQRLREELRGLTEEVPVAFSELSQIASFGAALDIPAAQLDEFSSTVARFIAITDVSAEEAGKSLARIFQYTNNDDVYRGSEAYEQLGSAILRLGNVSIATEPEVLKYSQAISPLGARAGVSAAQIIAMATATASFASINVEGAGSAFSRVFANIERNVKSGGENLEAFAQIAGVSSAQFQAMWDQDAGGAFNAVIEGLNKDLPNLVTNLDALGIRNERDKRVVQALAINYDSYARYLDESNTSLQEGTALGDAYAYVMDDLASKWQVFLNVLQNTAADIGAVLAPAFSGLLSVVTSVLKAIGDFAQTGFGSFILQLAGWITGAVAAWAAWRGAIALATAGTLAFKAASAFIGSPSIAKGAQFLAAQITGVGVAAQGATGKVAALGAATATAGGAGGVGKFRAGLGSVVSFLGGPWGLAFAAGAAVVSTFVANASSEISAGRAKIIEEFQAIGEGAEDALDLKDVFSSGFNDWVNDNTAFDWSGIFSDGTAELKQFNRVLSDTESLMAAASLQGGDTASAIRTLTSDFGFSATEVNTLKSGLGELSAVLQQAADSGGADLARTVKGIRDEFGLTDSQTLEFVSRLDSGLTPALKEAAEQVGINTRRTDWFNQLLGESGQKALEAGDGMTVMQAEAEATTAATEDLQEAVTELLDELTAFATTTGGVQGNLDALWSTIQGSSEALQEFRDAGGNLADLMQGGMNPASIALRDTFREINDQTLESVAGILEAGGSMDEASRAFRDGRQAIVDMLTELGAAPEVAEAWANAQFGAFDSVISKIQETGQAVIELNNGEQVTIKFNADTQKFEDAKTGTEISIDQLSGRTAEPTIDADPDPLNQKTSESNRKVTELDSRIARPDLDADDAIFNSRVTNAATRMDQLNRLLAEPRVTLQGASAAQQAAWAVQQAINSIRDRTVYLTTVATQVNRNIEETGRPGLWSLPGLSSGGYTGRGGKYEPAGIVHRGEYVIPKHLVDQTSGLPKADALGKLVKGVNTGIGYAQGGYVRRSPDPVVPSGPVDLSLSSLQALARMIPTQLVANGRVLAEVNSSENMKSTSRGAR